jgi:hypothetical protein
VIGQEEPVDSAPLIGPGDWNLLEIEPSDENLVEAFDRSREACNLEAPEVEVATQEATIRVGEELDSTPDVFPVRRGVKVPDHEVMSRRRDLH